MKVFVLALFSLIVSVNSEDAKPAQTALQPLFRNNKDNYYGTTINGNLDNLGNQENRFNLGYEENRWYRQRNNNRNEDKPSQIYGNNNYGYGSDDEYDNRKNVQLKPNNIGYYARDPES